MKIFIKLILSFCAAAYCNSATNEKLSGRIIDIGSQCDKYCIDTLRIIKNAKVKYLAISVLSQENLSMKFGDSVDIDYSEIQGSKFATKISKYSGFDDWYIGAEGALICWDIGLSDSIGEISEKQICLSKNTNPRVIHGSSISSSSGIIKGARIKGLNFHPKLQMVNHVIEISLEWNVGYVTGSRAITKTFQVVSGNMKITENNSNEFKTTINKTRDIVLWKQ